ncbi:glycosyltransferase [Bradyrhizobium sp. CSA207]|uniref:glycosyltransferase family 4 protein n=1 Tax=Bradyrhizobium sp. CSA207 TaxID=2698826 RepID=UPI0023B14B91|nr:glycosyltransferase family 4 protein [Bradyrhizobium sp. CSA207]MDE5447215.1 glycosyltransferase [Bradyrhizobium sp. CSA207]
MQNFNRRVIRNLLSRAQSRGESPPQMRFLRDGDSIPKDLAAVARSYPNRIAFILGSAIAGLTASVFIVGHINLLPIAALVRCFRWKTPILLFVHGDEVWNEPKRRKKRWHDSLFLRAVSRIASVSQYTADIMSQEFGVNRTKFRILPNAVDAVERPSSPDAKDTPVVLTVSRLSSGDRAKNIDQMLRAIALLKTRIPNVRYEVVGDGSLRGELEQLTRELGIGANVSFLGRLSDDELSQAYLRASVFALPSSKEGFGIVYLEAWLRLLPVICSSFGASKEVVSDGLDGFVVDHRDPDAISDRLQELLTDPLLARRFGEHGRKKVEAKYLNSSFQANLNAIIDSLQID